MAANGSRMSRRLGFRFFNAHDFTNVTKETILPNFLTNPIFGYALLVVVLFFHRQKKRLSFKQWSSRMLHLSILSSICKSKVNQNCRPGINSFLCFSSINVESKVSMNHRARVLQLDQSVVVNHLRKVNRDKHLCQNQTIMQLLALWLLKKRIQAAIVFKRQAAAEISNQRFKLFAIKI